jgi:hypothetical protein
VGVRLQRGREAVEAERDDARADPQHAAVLAHALPDQPRTTDLGQRGEGEQDERFRDRHGRSVAAMARGQPART